MSDANDIRIKYNNYMRLYNRKTYSTNKYHIRRIINTKNLLKQYDVDDEIKLFFNEYLYDAKLLVDIIQQMPSHMVLKIIDELINDNLFIKK